eukprot:13115809-Ditylum_brightwellii.AAC.1
MIPWPNQGRPSKKCWVLWHRYLKQCFAPTTSKSHHLNNDINLQSPLGAWAVPTSYTARQHYFDPEQTELYELHGGSFHIYKQISGRANWFQQTN